MGEVEADTKKSRWGGAPQQILGGCLNAGLHAASPPLDVKLASGRDALK